MAAGGFTAEHRELLERFAPLLQYDAQDAFRAVAADTMADNPPNLLRRGDGSLIAAHPDLSLAVLADYPGEQAFAKGDHLAAGPDLLGDAVRMQLDPRYPHCAYGRVLPGEGGRRWLQYWLWYYDNPKTFLGKGRHQGDWELVQIGLASDARPEVVTCSQHGTGETRDWPRVERAPGEPDRPLIFVAPFSHANYFEPKTTYYFPAADHPTRHGPADIPRVLPFDTWQRWRGRWGADLGLLGGAVRGLGGSSPSAPVLQATRWNRPARFCADARRPTATATKAAIWQVGRLSYPLSPEVLAVRLRGAELDVEYRLRQRLLQRSRDLLITVHLDEPRQSVVLSVVRRRVPQRGTVRLRLPRALDRCLVWASTFNKLGQRSTPVGPKRST